MSVSIFSDKGHPPSPEDISAALGSQQAAWDELSSFLRENYRVRGEYRFYGKNYGWAMRFQKGGKALVSLYPGQNRITAQVILGEPQVQEALALELGGRARQVIEAAHPYPEGRWLFLPIESEQDLEAVRKILQVKLRPKTQT